jgi:hypothetical protein
LDHQEASRGGFARFVNGEPDLYVQMQAHRDLRLAGRRLKHQLDRIEPAV